MAVKRPTIHDISATPIGIFVVLAVLYVVKPALAVLGLRCISAALCGPEGSVV